MRHECIAGPGQGQQAEVDIKHTGINQHRHAHDQGAGFGELMPLKATPQEIHAVHKQRQGNKGGGSPLDGNRSAGIHRIRVFPSSKLAVAAETWFEGEFC